MAEPLPNLRENPEPPVGGLMPTAEQDFARDLDSQLADDLINGGDSRCEHDSTRVTGWLDDHCLRCGARGYWKAGVRLAYLCTHPSGKTLVLPYPEDGDPPSEGEEE